PHAFIREDDKKKLNMAFRRKIFLTNNAKWWEEPLLFMLSLGMAEEKVYLSHSYLDEKGREASPSIFFREALNILKINEKRDDRFKKIPVSDVIARIEDALEKDELTISVVKALNSSDKTYAEELLELIGNRDGFGKDIARLLELNSIERLRDAKDADALKWKGWIVNNDLISHLRKDFLGGENLWTATMLETLAKCPFSFYMKYILKLDEKEEPDIEMDDLTQGNILHRILERFYKTAKDKGMLPFKGNDKEVELLIKEALFIFEGIERNDFIGNKKLWDIKKNKIISILNRLYKDESERHDEEFIPEYFEIEFGEGKHIPLLNIILSKGETIRINGKIDRIDTAQNGLRIIDYKSGSTPEPDEIGRIYFQIPIYVLAASNLYAQRLKYSGFYYLLKKVERKEIKTIKDENGGIPLHEYIFIHNDINKSAYRASEQSRPRRDEARSEAYFQYTPQRRARSNAGMRSYDALYNSQNRTLAKDIDALISNIRLGNFKTEPHNEKACANCRFWSICRYAGTGKDPNPALAGF
ncbi:MAG: PD-(D/E)XK nuclease family protein, partial [Deltaproteobacteria bacterium]|nr:PD-(D/E)XK nuclease family protein [Deltaproteobacteria bacterium]